MDINKRCDECGKFYHEDAMKGRLCFNCADFISGEEKYFVEDDSDTE